MDSANFKTCRQGCIKGRHLNQIVQAQNGAALTKSSQHLLKVNMRSRGVLSRTNIALSISQGPEIIQVVTTMPQPLVSIRLLGPPRTSGVHPFSVIMCWISPRKGNIPPVTIASDNMAFSQILQSTIPP